MSCFRLVLYETKWVKSIANITCKNNDDIVHVNKWEHKWHIIMLCNSFDNQNRSNLDYLDFDDLVSVYMSKNWIQTQKEMNKKWKDKKKDYDLCNHNQNQVKSYFF